jgi:hypothetical protein
MTAETSLAFPGARVLAGWWKQLAIYQPRALWIGHLLLHRVEALVSLQETSRLDSLALFVLKTLSLASWGTLDELESRLHLGLSLLHRVLCRLQSESLLESNAQGIWSLTQVGRQSLELGAYPRACEKRRVFYFVEDERFHQGPQFVPLRDPRETEPWVAQEGWRFRPQFLEASFRQPREWKHRRGFPLDVLEILSGVPPRAEASARPEERIMLDRPEHLLAVLALTAESGDMERLLGFGIHQAGWALQTSEPAFVLLSDWQEVFPDLTAEPSLEQWRLAWRAWYQPRGLPQDLTEACVLQRQGYRLQVRAPGRLVEHLRIARSDALRGESWLLGGAGRIRVAVRIEIIDAAC